MAAGIKYRLFVHSRQQELAIIFADWSVGRAVGVLPSQRRRWWTNSKTTLAQRLMFAGIRWLVCK